VTWEFVVVAGFLKRLVLGESVDNKRIRTPYFVLAVSIILSLGITLFFYRSALSRDTARFNNSVSRVQSAIENKINLYIALLQGARGFVDATDDLDREKFADYVKGLDLNKNYAGVRSIGFSRIVFADERDAFLKQMDEEGATNFKIFPEGKRDLYHAIAYLEPFDEQTKKAVGYDMSADEKSRQALAYARDLASATLSPKAAFEFETEADKQSGFFIYLPVYRDGKIPPTIQERQRNLVGYIFSPFRAADFLNLIHKEIPASDVAVRIYDAEAKPESLLAQSSFVEPQIFDDRGAETFYSKSALELAGRRWVIEYVPLPAAAEQTNRNWVPLIFGAGVVFSFILFGLSYAQAASQNKIHDIAGDLFELEQQKHALFEKEKQARLEAETANATKDEFISVVSHELRTPLNAIAGWTKILESENLPEETKELALKKIGKNLRRQTRLVEELLDFSQVIAGKVELETSEVEFARIFENAISEMEPIAHVKNINFLKINKLNGQTIIGDRKKIETVIRNLLSNAIKFTPSGGTVEAEAKEKTGNVELIVKDSGKGIRRDFLPFIFDRFRQDDASSTRFYGGFGLGLAISAHIVKLHHGSIEASSEGVDKGSVFVVKFPVNKA
jgi:signal transduction histidine kinase